MSDEAAFAKKFLEDVLSFFEINTEAEVVDGDEIIELSVTPPDLSGFLIGHNGEMLYALQTLTNMAARNSQPEAKRVSVDISDYKKQRAQRTAEKAKSWIASAQNANGPLELPPMNAADRRIVHQAVSETPGLTSESEGYGHNRHIVIKPE